VTVSTWTSDPLGWLWFLRTVSQRRRKRVLYFLDLVYSSSSRRENCRSTFAVRHAYLIKRDICVHRFCLLCIYVYIQITNNVLIFKFKAIKLIYVKVHRFRYTDTIHLLCMHVGQTKITNQQPLLNTFIDYYNMYRNMYTFKDEF